MPLKTTHSARSSSTWPNRTRPQHAHKYREEFSSEATTVYDHEHFPTQPYVRIKHSAQYTQTSWYSSIRNTAMTDENIIYISHVRFPQETTIYWNRIDSPRNVPVTVYFIYTYILLSLAFLYNILYQHVHYVCIYSTVVDCFKTVHDRHAYNSYIPRSMRADCNATVCFELYDYYFNLRYCRDDGLLLIMCVCVCLWAFDYILCANALVWIRKYFCV